MTIPLKILIAALMALAFGVAPVALVWGWMRWVRCPKQWTFSSILVFGSIILSSVSAMFAAIMYSSNLPPDKLFVLGLVTSIVGLLFALTGIWKKSSVRWHGLGSALGVLAFWLLVAAST